MESVNRYRAYASDCLRLAGKVDSQASKSVLLDMARAWVRLAEQAEKNSQVDLVYESPPRPLAELPLLPPAESMRDAEHC